MSGLSVRQLALSTCQQGDLYPVREGLPVDAQLGMEVAREIQRRRSEAIEGFSKEVSFELQYSFHDESKTLRGRADGLFEQAPGQWVIEEYKCVRGKPQTANSVDLAQALIYAGMHAATHDTPADYEIRLIYVDPADFSETVFSREIDSAAAQFSLDLLLLCYALRQQRHIFRCAARDHASTELSFPYPRYRTSQQAIARRVYQAIRDGEQLLLEAPTGSGKSLAVTYPALRAMRGVEQLFFATTRTTGARAALDAMQQLDPQAEHFVVVQIAAKEAVCPIEGMPCRADQCPRAAGYYDRLHDAVVDGLARKYLTQQAIDELAQAHNLCPFELSLDLSNWADVLVGDYNYLFDPRVRLQRLRNNSDLHLLLDEAHQLSPRAIDMLSVQFARSSLRAALKQAPQVLKPALQRVDRKMLEAARPLAEGEQIVTPELFEPINASMQKCIATLADLELDLSEWPQVRDTMFAMHAWLQSSQWLDNLPWSGKVEVASKPPNTLRHINLTKHCIDPARYIAGVLAEHGASVRFSATVSPLPLYQRLHGLEENGVSERAASPFDASQLGLFIVDDVPTYYRQRQRSLPQLAALVTQIYDTSPGRYLVALPSYAYLTQLQDALSELSMPLLAQQPQMELSAKAQFLDDLASHEHCVALIVMGGIFGESVDLGAAQLRGVVLVGLGLPPPDLLRDQVQQHFARQETVAWGKLVAFTQPALVKVVQTAGRLLRSETDQGVVCLIDERFKDPTVAQFFPSHWQPQVVSAATLSIPLQQFWASSKKPLPADANPTMMDNSPNPKPMEPR